MNEKQNIIKMLEKALELAKKIGEEKPVQKEPGEPFCPVNRQEAFFIDGMSEIGCFTEYGWNDFPGKNLIQNGFVFPTNEKAEKKFQRIKAILHLERLVEDLNEDWEPDWDDCYQKKWHIQILDGKLNFEYFYKKNSVLPPFKSVESAKIAASKLSDDEIKSIFNVTEFTR